MARASRVKSGFPPASIYNSGFNRMRSGLLNLRLWLEARGLFPKGKLAFLTCYLLGLDLLLFIIMQSAGLFHANFGQYLSGWVIFLTVGVAALGSFLLANLLSSTLLWRLRNRLVVTYVFIGVIPLILLATLTLGTFYLFAGQFATFIVTSKLASELKGIESTNLAISREAEAGLAATGAIPALRAAYDG